jgi:hypothetical protein
MHITAKANLKSVSEAWVFKTRAPNGWGRHDGRFLEYLLGIAGISSGTEDYENIWLQKEDEYITRSKQWNTNRFRY